jgi:hypothetical protein
VNIWIEPLTGFVLKLFCINENIITIVVSVVIALEALIGMFIYRRTAARWSSVTLEKQVWQIWVWAIFITIVVYGITFKAGVNLFSISLNIIAPEDINIAILIALVATGVLTSKPFFFKLTISLIILNVIIKMLLANFTSLILLGGATNILLPFVATGIYFLMLQHRQLKEGTSHGVK